MKRRGIRKTGNRPAWTSIRRLTTESAIEEYEAETPTQEMEWYDQQHGR